MLLSHCKCILNECIRFSNSRVSLNVKGPLTSVRCKSDKKCDRTKLLDAFRSCLYTNLKKQDVEEGNKVSIVGAGAVGMACSIGLLAKNVTNNLAIHDCNKDLCSAERLDLMHGSMFLNNCHIDQSCDVEATKNSRVVVVSAGARVKVNQTRLQVSQETAEILKKLMPELVKLSPKAIYIIVCNPADVMIWVAQKVTNLPYERCISTGCHLDTARFRMYISQILGVSTKSVHGYVIGEHGETSVPLWSSVSVGGVRLQELNPTIGTENDSMKWSCVHKDVVNAAYKVISVKGYTNWAIGLTIVDIISAIFEDSNRIISLSTNVKGMCGINDDIFLSLPCIVNKSGLRAIVHPKLSDWEKCHLHKSAEALLKAQCGVKL